MKNEIINSIGGHLGQPVNYEPQDRVDPTRSLNVSLNSDEWVVSDIQVVFGVAAKINRAAQNTSVGGEGK